MKSHSCLVSVGLHGMWTTSTVSVNMGDILLAFSNTVASMRALPERQAILETNIPSLLGPVGVRCD